MNRLSKLATRFFGSLPGLLLVVVAWEALIVASLSPFSGPVRGLGLADLLGVDFSDAGRVGRIIMLYHSLAIPFVAALVYLVLDQVPFGTPEELPRRRKKRKRLPSLSKSKRCAAPSSCPSPPAIC